MKKSHYPFMIISLFALFYIFVPAASAESSKQLYKVGTDTLNVRQAPAHYAEVIGYLHTGDRVTAFQEKHGWIQTYYDGKKVWVASQYLYKTNQTIHKGDISNTVTITKDTVHLRTGPGTNHSIAGFAGDGDTFTLIDSVHNWHKVISEGGAHVWVASWLTDQPTGAPDASDDETPSESIPASETTTNTTA